MLVSHQKKFIFTKTVKTAGTSVESYFEKYCMPEGAWKESHARDEYVSDAGIIGYRGSDRGDSTFYNHMSAKSIKLLIGADIWNEYYKFTVVRNPYDKLVSGFTMFEARKKSYSFDRRLKAFFRKLLRRGSAIDRVDGKTEIERFRHWIKMGGFINDRDKYLIDGEVVMDFFIKQEDLTSGIKSICERLEIEFEPSRVPTFKKGLRTGKPKTRDYYDEETKMIVEERYKWEFEHFGYVFPSDK